MKHSQIRKRLIATILLTLVGVLFLMPLLWMVSSSLKKAPEVFSVVFRWIPEDPQWKNYIKVLTSKAIPMLAMFKNSLFIAVCTIAGQLLIASLAAYAFAIIQFKGKNVVFILLLCSMMIPTQATLIPRFVMFQYTGLYDTHAALILPAWFSVSSIFLLRQFYQKVPKDLVEAALMDGASHIRIWWQVMLPLTKTAMTSLMILAFIDSWNDYLAPLVFLNDKKLFTVSLGIDLYDSTDFDFVNRVMAAATVVITPVIILFTACQKQFVEGITTSGIKG